MQDDNNDPQHEWSSRNTSFGCGRCGGHGQDGMAGHGRHGHSKSQGRQQDEAHVNDTSSNEDRLQPTNIGEQVKPILYPVEVSHNFHQTSLI